MKRVLISQQQVLEILDRNIEECNAALDYRKDDEQAQHDLKAMRSAFRIVKREVAQLHSMEREILVTRNTQLHVKFQ